MRAWWVLALLLVCAAGYADGKFFRYVEGPTKLPRQGALIHFDQGVETMIVESSLEGDPGSYLWLLPVPSEPLSVEPAMPGVIESLRRTVLPNFAGGELPGVIAALMAIVVVPGAYGLWRGNQLRGANRPLRHLIECLLVLMVLAGVVTVLFPVYAGAGGGPGVDERFQTVDAGSYTVTVVPPDQLRAYLDQEKPVVSASERAVLDAYASDGWYLCAARLKVSKGGLAAPHPLKVRFRSERPIYPMRLTATGNGSMLLDLFVAAPGTASANGLNIWRSEEMRQAEPGDSSTWQPSSHPELAALDLERMMLTRLRGELDLGRQEGDLVLSVGKAQKMRATVASPTAAAVQGLYVAIPLLALLLVIQGNRLSRRPNATRRDLATFATQAVVVSLLTATVVYGSFEKVNLTPSTGRLAANSALHLLLDDLENVAEPVGDDFPALVSSIAREAYSSRNLDPVEYSRDVPNGYTVERAPGGYRVTLYNSRAGVLKSIIKRSKY